MRKPRQLGHGEGRDVYGVVHHAVEPGLWMKARCTGVAIGTNEEGLRTYCPACFAVEYNIRQDYAQPTNDYHCEEITANTVSTKLPKPKPKPKPISQLPPEARIRILAQLGRKDINKTINRTNKLFVQAKLEETDAIEDAKKGDYYKPKSLDQILRKDSIGFARRRFDKPGQP